MSIRKILNNPNAENDASLNLTCTTMICETVQTQGTLEIKTGDGNVLNYSTPDLGQDMYSLHTDGQGGVYWAPDQTGSSDIAYVGTNGAVGKHLKMTDNTGQFVTDSSIVEDATKLDLGGLELDLQDKKATSSYVPVDPVDLTNKQFVDDVKDALQSQIDSNDVDILALQAEDVNLQNQITINRTDIDSNDVEILALQTQQALNITAINDLQTTDTNLQTQITNNSNNIASNDVDILALQNKTQNISDNGFLTTVSASLLGTADIKSSFGEITSETLNNPVFKLSNTNGSTVLGGEVGNIRFNSNFTSDTNKIRAIATENHSGVSKGSSLQIMSAKNGTTAPSLCAEFKEDSVYTKEINVTGVSGDCKVQYTGVGETVDMKQVNENTYLSNLNSANKVNKSGDSMSGDLLMGTNKVTSVAPPINADDLTNKIYVDSEDALLQNQITTNQSAISVNTSNIGLKVSKSGDTMTGDLNMGANRVTTSLTPTTGIEMTNKSYVDAQDTLLQNQITTNAFNIGTNDTDILNLQNTKVNKSGDTMTGNLILSGAELVGLSNRISSSYVPVANDDLCNKLYVDTTVAGGSFLPLTGGTLTGNLVMSGGDILASSNKVTSSYIPLANDDLCNKLYVDTADTAIQSQVTNNTTNVGTALDRTQNLTATATNSTFSNQTFNLENGNNQIHCDTNNTKRCIEFYRNSGGTATLSGYILNNNSGNLELKAENTGVVSVNPKLNIVSTNTCTLEFNGTADKIIDLDNIGPSTPQIESYIKGFTSTGLSTSTVSGVYKDINFASNSTIISNFTNTQNTYTYTGSEIGKTYFVSFQVTLRFTGYAGTPFSLSLAIYKNGTILDSASNSWSTTVESANNQNYSITELVQLDPNDTIKLYILQSSGVNQTVFVPKLHAQIFKIN